MVLAGNLEQCGECLCIPVHQRTDFVGDVLADQHNRNVLALLGEVGERLFNFRDGRLGEPVMRTLLSTTKKFFCPSLLTSPTPARINPVVESLQ